MTVILTELDKKEKTQRYHAHLVFDGGEGRMEGKELDLLGAFLPEAFSGELPDGTLPCIIDWDMADELLHADRVSRAVMKGADLLDLAEQTCGMLLQKLTARGFPKKDAEEALRYLAKKGMLREDAFLERYLHTLCETKRIGPTRIRMEVIKKGFSRTAMANVYDEVFAALDFEEPLRRRIEKIGIEAFSDPKSAQKQIASLMRAGYPLGMIKKTVASMQ